MLMRTLRLLLRRETVAPMLAMLFATAVCFVLVLVRMLAAGGLYEGIRRHAGLMWNLVLAWLPLIFALLACEEWRGGTKRNWRFIGFAAATVSGDFLPQPVRNAKGATMRTDMNVNNFMVS